MAPRGGGHQLRGTSAPAPSWRPREEDELCWVPRTAHPQARRPRAAPTQASCPHRPDLLPGPGQPTGPRLSSWSPVYIQLRDTGEPSLGQAHRPPSLTFSLGFGPGPAGPRSSCRVSGIPPLLHGARHSSSRLPATLRPPPTRASPAQQLRGPEVTSSSANSSAAPAGQPSHWGTARSSTWPRVPLRWAPLPVQPHPTALPSLPSSRHWASSSSQ